MNAKKRNWQSRRLTSTGRRVLAKWSRAPSRATARAGSAWTNRVHAHGPLELSDRYEMGVELGAGGMGVVYAAVDRRIGREVAMKTMLVKDRESRKPRLRFLREACVQGQLEHPAIVPVYDLGCDSDGALYFSMKRVHGETLDEVVQRLRSGDPVAARLYTQRKLLTAFASVCHPHTSRTPAASCTAT